MKRIKIFSKFIEVKILGKYAYHFIAEDNHTLEGKYDQNREIPTILCKEEMLTNKAEKTLES